MLFLHDLKLWGLRKTTHKSEYLYPLLVMGVLVIELRFMSETTDGGVLLDLCIAIMKSSGTKFRACLSQDFKSVSWKNSIQLCGYLLK